MSCSTKPWDPRGVGVLTMYVRVLPGNRSRKIFVKSQKWEHKDHHFEGFFLKGWYLIPLWFRIYFILLLLVSSLVLVFSRSREEIEMWKEKQRQVKAEEEKSKNNKSVMSEARTSNLVIRPQAPGAADIVEEESWNKHKWVISDVCYRELWTEQAEILIRQVQLTEWLLFKLCPISIYIQFSSRFKCLWLSFPFRVSFCRLDSY